MSGGRNPIYAISPSGLAIPVQCDANGNLLLGASGLTIGNVEVLDGGGVNKLAIDASGRLTLVNTLASPLAVAQTLNGAVLSATNPEPNISNIQQLILNSQVFSCSTGAVAAAASMAGEWFSANTSTKNVLIWSIQVGYSNANQSLQFTHLTAQDANITGAGVTHVIANALNLKDGGSGPQASVSMDYNGGVATTSGTPVGFYPSPFTQVIELLSPGEFRYIPSGTAGGFAVYQTTTATGKWGITVRWAEF